MKSTEKTPQRLSLAWPPDYSPGALGGFWRGRRKLILSLLAVALLLSGLGFITHGTITRSLQDILSKNLQATLEADITALTIWMENEKREVRQWAERDVLISLVEKLLARTGPDINRQTLLNASSQASLRELLDANGEDRGFMVIDRTGLVLASDDDAAVGLRLSPQGLAMMGRTWETGAYITHPFPKHTLLVPARPDPWEAQMLALSAVRNKSRSIIAALAFTIDPEEDFTRILSVARVGETGNTYAFNREATLLSENRFDDQLREIGLLPDTPRAQSILNLQVRDPGGDMTRGYRPERPPEEWPLTRMAASAISGQNGMNVDGYRDYRGVRVVGVWRWLPAYDFGVATEVTLDEALQVIQPLTLAYWTLFGLAIAGTLAILIAHVVITRLRRRIHETQRIDRYTLERKIGEGGMSEVYLARHQLLRRPTALKLLRTDRIRPETLARFEREVQLTSRLRHPNTIVIYDYGHTPEGIFYYVMEYVGGITLARLIEVEGAVPPARAMYLLRQVCASLHEAHGIGLIHRDIKPTNLLLCQMGGEPDFVKVLDFGLVKDIEEAHDQSLTETHTISGTPLYIAPERLREPRHLGPCCDIYSLGVVGYNLITGKDLYEAENSLELTHQTLHAPVPRPSQHSSHEVPAALDELIMACLSKDPAHRPATVREIIDRLDAIESTPHWDWQRARAWWEQHADILQAPSADSKEESSSSSCDSDTVNAADKSP